MSVAGRSALAVVFLVLAAVSRAQAQDPASPPDRPGDGTCCGRFTFRMPRMSMRAMRPMHFDRMDRMDMGRFRMRGLERSMGRLDRSFQRGFAMRDRDMDRHMGLRERAMERMHQRLERLNRLDRFDRLDWLRLERPFRMRHWRTI